MTKTNLVKVVLTVFFFVTCVSAANFETKSFKPYKTKKVVNGKMVDFIAFGKPGFSSSHRNLCGPNEQMGVDTFVTSTECCEKNDDGVCISQKNCRMPKATCLDKDSDGNVTGYYESFGEKECGSCVSIELDNPAEVLGF